MEKIYYITLCVMLLAGCEYPGARVGSPQEVQQCLAVAESAAPAFASREGLERVREGAPGVIRQLHGSVAVADATGAPRWTSVGEATSRIDLTRGVVYLGRMDDLYAELGKWYFYPPEYVPGVSRLDDIKWQRRLVRFERACRDQE